MEKTINKIFNKHTPLMYITNDDGSPKYLEEELQEKYIKQKILTNQLQRTLDYFKSNIVDIEIELRQKAIRNKEKYNRTNNDLFKGRYEAANTAINKLRNRFYGRHAIENYKSEKQRADYYAKNIEILKEEILKLNNEIVNRGIESEIAISGKVIEILENTLIDDWRINNNV